MTASLPGGSVEVAEADSMFKLGLPARISTQAKLMEDALDEGEI
jgi:hypothetical protein